MLISQLIAKKTYYRSRLLYDGGWFVGLNKDKHLLHNLSYKHSLIRTEMHYTTCVL